jgi:ribulose-bisphosphate carboxylase large chain
MELVRVGFVEIAFPTININFQEDGISHLLVQIMGGQLDIDTILECRIVDIQLNSLEKFLLGPKIGIKEMRKYCDSYNKPLFGGIVKPKTGLRIDKHLDLVKNLVDGGCDFIKEDEILCNPEYISIEKRTEKVMEYIRDSGRKVFYCVSIHSDHAYILNNIKKVYDNGGNGVHVNFHCGLGVYKSIREMDLPILLHFQKSGDKLLTGKNHNFSIDESVIFKLVGMSGCSTLHCGMIGGYLNDETLRTKLIVNTLNKINCVPALSCGMHAGLVEYINNELGTFDWMANVGGSLFSHPGGTLAGVKAMRQSVDRNYSNEYRAAIEKWGLKC